MAEPLIQIRGLRREFPAGDHPVVALSDINLTIEAGEMVAIMGASGSGKSTLMNILGCLDRPTSGSYRIAGRDTALLDPDELAQLRREHFGFIFQRYHLLADLDALANVEVPAVYAGVDRQARKERAEALLGRLGLGDRLRHRPSQLSGGQQQRVSIARALMNGGQVILADEPTGALDSRSGAEMMRILEELHAEGHTIILVTHDASVASHARRVIEISDGQIVADRINEDRPPRAAGRSSEPHPPRREASWLALADRLGEAARMALTAMNAHRMRTILTMLGIIIGIASVVSVVALGEGSRRQVLKNIAVLGTNTIDIYPGAGFGDLRSQTIRTLMASDADALARQPYIDSVTPTVSTSETLLYHSVAANGTVNGVGDGYFRVRGVELAEGRAFTAQDVADRAQVAVIDDNTKAKLFPNGQDPIGEVVMLGPAPCRIIGVAAKRDNGFFVDQNLNVWLPYTTVLGRMTGASYLRSITARIADGEPTDAAQGAIERFMTLRHGRTDFFLSNSDSIRRTIETTTQTLGLLITMIAFISLVVGGIGVMNIMLVSVVERTGEIGVRTSVGARRSDIMSQFLIEAVLVCLLGGFGGVALALGLGLVFHLLAHGAGGFSMVYSPAAIVVAFAFSTLIGLVFGFMPARNAARLDPVQALARE